METFIAKSKLLFTDKILRRKILFLLGFLTLFRFLAAIPIPGIDASSLDQFFSTNQFLGLINLFSGGGLSGLSIVMLGVGPYITASIIMQLMTVMIPRLKEMYHEEGEAGKKKFSMYSRLLTVPLAAIQGFGFLIIFQRQGVIADLDLFSMITNIGVIIAGSVLMMWIGELMTEYGIGNGVSILIFAGIVAGLPSNISQLIYTFEPSQIPLYIGFLVAAVLITLGIVVVTEAERPVPITYAKRVRGMKVYGGISTYLPLRINQAGVMPIIFALSILLFPQMIFNFLANFNNETFQSVAQFVLKFLNNGWFYSIFYFILVFVFTYFYTAITFDPASISKNLQQSGAFIPGVRPGQSTTDHIAKTVTRITLVGALFLGAVAVLPVVMQAITGITTLAIGGTGLLIVVAVVIDLVKRIDAQMSMREY
ncbi:preprotein translocase subunit SecY [Candidatus Campbellbacteria bacterium CG22_combo_CG10-13_8_21_14_all_36_13]|uniref:Protein translocase subunit SecY n=1 Tax=Candidatus Campbellbacteria bacterium CG22_combo_CG10-13_8_21_14_all_36_13 TaxID=1974529 RepID=A0A2H0DY94_9BACT|nr:MAG: preprotein translocase subunit SecY [Candidatus Campbellbacteria bacterium CG22_combo_CG10-13_8_21_14_all_36_13]